MNKRDALLALFAIGAASGILRAQTPGRNYRIGIINASNSKATLDREQMFVARLADLGFVEGRNLVVERRNSGGKLELLPALAAELVATKPDLIFAPPAPVTAVVQAATSTIPIVFCYVSDAVALGFAKSLARPGGNLTGLSNSSNEIAGKRVEILKEISPQIRRLAIWRNSDAVNDASELIAAEIAAKRLGLRTIVIDARNPQEYTLAAAATRRAGADAVYLVSSPVAGNNRKLILGLIAELKKPAVYWTDEFVVEGGLISYSTDFADLARRAAGYAARILRGAKPGELPIELPLRLETALNMRAARALGLSIPQSILLRAERVIE